MQHQSQDPYTCYGEVMANHNRVLVAGRKSRIMPQKRRGYAPYQPRFSRPQHHSFRSTPYTWSSYIPTRLLESAALGEHLGSTGPVFDAMHAAMRPCCSAWAREIDQDFSTGQHISRKLAP